MLAANSSYISCALIPCGDNRLRAYPCELRNELWCKCSRMTVSSKEAPPLCLKAALPDDDPKAVRLIVVSTTQRTKKPFSIVIAVSR